MNTSFDPQRGDRVLEAVLRDGQWRLADAELKRKALGAFQARQRLRQMTRWTACAAVLAVFGYALHQPARAPTAHRQDVVKASPTLGQVQSQLLLTDRELLASFPRGSCFMAEVNGHRELVFVDSEVERKFLGSPK